MTQTVIGLFDTLDDANAAEAALMKQGIEQSSIYFSAKEDTQGAGGQPGQSMEAIRDFLSELFGKEGADDAESYANQIDRGGILLSVDLPDDADVDPVCTAMQDAGALDLDAPQAQTQAGASAEGETVPVIEEEMEVGKRKAGQGKVRVVSRMVETPVQEEVSLQEERATVERRPADRPASPAEIEAAGERTVEVEESSEQPVVSKSARVTEEVELGKETTEKTQTVEDTVRHTEVDVEREPASKEGKRKGRKQ